MDRRSYLGAMGVAGSVGLTGCLAPLFVGVVAHALSLPPTSAALVVGTYVSSVVVLIISLTVATGMELVAGAGRLAAHSETLERIAGAVMVVAGVGQLYLAIVILDVI